MKKSILFALMIVGLVGSFFVGSLRSQEQKAVQKVFKPLKKPIRFLGGGVIDDTQETKTQETKTQKLRSEHQQLVNQLLQIINDQNLTARIAVKKELSEHQAKAELEQAKKILQKILKTYPKSEAATQAREMLETQKRVESKKASAQKIRLVSSLYLIKQVEGKSLVSVLRSIYPHVEDARFSFDERTRMLLVVSKETYRKQISQIISRVDDTLDKDK